MKTIYKATDGEGKSITTEGMELEEAYEFFFKAFFLRAMHTLYTNINTEKLELSEFNQNGNSFYLQDMDNTFLFNITLEEN